MAVVTTRNEFIPATVDTLYLLNLDTGHFKRI